MRQLRLTSQDGEAFLQFCFDFGLVIGRGDQPVLRNSSLPGCSWTHLLGKAVFSHCLFTSTKTSSIFVKILSLVPISSVFPMSPLWFGQQLVKCPFKEKGKNALLLEKYCKTMKKIC